MTGQEKQYDMRASFTLDEWLTLRKISRSMFYKLESEGKTPRTYNVGNRRYVSPQADDDWLRQREAESVSEAA